MYLGLLFLLGKLSSAQKDPLNDFCRRFGHQTAVVDEKLYIDGGLVNWNPISQNPGNLTNTWLLWNDLTTSPAGIGVPQLSANLSKNASIPSVSGGSLWSDSVNKRLFLYGGDYYAVTPNSPEVLSYDVLNNIWVSFGPPGGSIGSVSFGGNVGVSEIGKAYILGGWLSNSSMPIWNGAPQATSYLLEYDMDSGQWTNSTGPDNLPRAEGSMVYIPASDNGLLVYFGGGVVGGGNLTGQLEEEGLHIIHVYDVKSSQWYVQKSVGDIPLPRRRFCAGAAWAPDHSSYNIYIYGGLGFNNSAGFDDVYILSLPSFTWIKWWEGSGVGKPHHTLTCNVVQNGQMLIIGGTFPLNDACDSPTTWGTHNLDLGKQTGKMWVEYQTNITSYVVPDEVIKVVGGTSSGGATATAPAAGFDNADLSVYFSQKAAVVSRTPTRPIPKPTSSHNSPGTSSAKLSTGAIIGIAVGGAVVLIALVAGIWCCVSHKRKTRTQPQSQPQMAPGMSYPSVPGYSEGNFHSPISGSVHSPNPSHAIPSPMLHHQLQAEPVPVELAAHRMDSPPSKGAYYPVTVLENHDTLSSNRGYESPVIVSPVPSHVSHTGDNNSHDGHSPAPRYAEIGRRTPRRGLQNQTYYSP